MDSEIVRNDDGSLVVPVPPGRVHASDEGAESGDLTVLPGPTTRVLHPGEGGYDEALAEWDRQQDPDREAAVSTATGREEAMAVVHAVAESEDHDVAAAVAEALGAEKLIFLTDVPGVMIDQTDPDSLVAALTAGRARAMIGDGTIGGGMVPKIEGCLRALDGGVGSVHLVDGRQPHVLLLELLTDAGVGTMLTRT